MQLAKTMSLEYIDSISHRAVALFETPGCHDRFVVTGDARKAQFFFLSHCQVQALNDGRGNTRANGHCRLSTSRMNSVGEKNDVGVGHRVDPQRSPCEARVTKRPHRQ